jgi:hypothetical protein
MRPLVRDEILVPDAYEAARPAFRDAIIRLKQDRRLTVGDRVTLVFENRETLRFQVQEMVRVERIHDPALVQHELDVYNELMPGEGELSATLMLEITEMGRIRRELDRLVGIDEHVSFVLGEDGDEEAIRARFDPKQMEADRIAAVQYIKFSFRPAQVARLADSDVRARVRVDHPNYRHERDLPAAMRESLLGDLRGEPAPLLDLEQAHAPEPAPAQVLRETQRVRSFRPAREPDCVVVEPVQAGLSLLTIDPELLGELLEEVRRAAREVVAESGACRIVSDVGPAPLRWTLHPRPA